MSHSKKFAIDIARSDFFEMALKTGVEITCPESSGFVTTIDYAFSNEISVVVTMLERKCTKKSLARSSNG